MIHQKHNKYVIFLHIMQLERNMIPRSHNFKYIIVAFLTICNVNYILLINYKIRKTLLKQIFKLPVCL